MVENALLRTNELPTSLSDSRADCSVRKANETTVKDWDKNMQHLSVGSWANVNESCPVNCEVSGSDMARVLIGEDLHSVELLFNAEGLGKLAAAINTAVTEMDALERQEAAGWDARQEPALIAPGGMP